MDSTARICLAKNADTLNQSKTKFYSLELIIAYSRLNDRNITKQIMNKDKAMICLGYPGKRRTSADMLTISKIR